MTYRYSIPVLQPVVARRIVRNALDQLPDSVVDNAELLTSELVTNAVVHGSARPLLVLEVDDASVRIEVRDAGPNIDMEALQVDPSSEHGRGLAIVETLASSWGIEALSTGKAVWFRLNVQV